jgi:hypothetical protein
MRRLCRRDDAALEVGCGDPRGGAGAVRLWGAAPRPRMTSQKLPMSRQSASARRIAVAAQLARVERAS